MHSLFDERRYLIPFRSGLLPQIFTDTLVIGAGVGGLRAAIAAAASGGETIVLCKTSVEESNTAWAQGGIATVVDEKSGDSFASHIKDTLDAGAGLCDEPAVRSIVEAGPARINELVNWGMRFDLGPSGRVSLGQEGAHTHARILHADGDATGRELVRCLHERARATPGLRLFSNCFALDLITPSNEPGGGAPVMGAITHHTKYGLQMIWAKTTILASGGAGVVFRETTNPRIATADGLAMAYRAGAAVQDLAFIQFHPTTLYLAGRPRSLITEAVRGEGAHLLDQAGHRFMVEAHPLAELAPRDAVSRAILRRIASHGGTHVFLDVRHLGEFDRRFPGIAALLADVGLDPATDLVPVNPAMHHFIGGVVTDLEGRTSLPGLLAVGEVASTGLHGANRLASNSLLEGLVVGEAAGRLAAANAARTLPAPVPIISDIRPSDHGEIDLADVKSSLRSAMWRNAGIERSGPRLADAIDMIDFWARYTLDKIFDGPEGWQTQNMLLAAALIARSAAWRTESRGGHWRSDFPEPREECRVHDRWARGAGNVVEVGVR
ncbi:MAG: L-aspartate oxidase [Phycisphaerales bacterium]|nr:L-aspartate oxidase [Phycisphaerales bacterium]